MTTTATADIDTSTDISQNDNDDDDDDNDDDNDYDDDDENDGDNTCVDIPSQGCGSPTDVFGQQKWIDGSIQLLSLQVRKTDLQALVAD